MSFLGEMYFADKNSFAHIIAFSILSQKKRKENVRYLFLHPFDKLATFLNRSREGSTIFKSQKERNKGKMNSYKSILIFVFPSKDQKVFQFTFLGLILLCLSRIWARLTQLWWFGSTQ